MRCSPTGPPDAWKCITFTILPLIIYNKAGMAVAVKACDVLNPRTIRSDGCTIRAMDADRFAP